MPQWKFRRMAPSEQNRAPVEAAFFRLEGEAIPALVREVIQNSLDAAVVDRELVRVRFFVSGEQAALPRAAAERWLGGLWPRLEASGIDGRSLKDAGSVPFLAIEDFGTRGLEGNPDLARSADDPESGKKEDFFYFWRNVGRTGKIGTTRGSWGLGKAVYPAASRIRTHLGLTVRAVDRQELLMGQAVMDLHHLPGDNRTQFDAYGFYGECRQAHNDPDFVSPASDSGSVARFRSDFKLTRTTEPGFSIAIPFPDKEFTEADCGDDFALAAIEHFFYPLLSRQLAVEVVTPGQTHHLHHANVVETLESISNRRGGPAPVLPLLELAAWALRHRHASAITMLERSASLRADWSDLRIPEDLLPALQARYKGGEPVAFRVPVLVRLKGGAPQLSHLDVCLQQHGSTRNTFRFLRQGLTISREHGPTGSGSVGLAIVEDEPLARLLRDAENPAHTQWICREERLKNNYLGGDTRVRLVTSAPGQLLKRLLDTGGNLDRDLLADLFPEPAPDALQPGRQAKRKNVGGSVEPIGLPPGPVGPPPAISFEQVSGGFVMRRRPSVPLPSDTLLIEMAYDCTGGDPFKAWEPFDFSLDRTRFGLAIEGGEIEERQGNRMRLRISADDFALKVTGFSLLRDLVIRSRWLHQEREAQT